MCGLVTREALLDANPPPIFHSVCTSIQIWCNSRNGARHFCGRTRHHCRDMKLRVDSPIRNHVDICHPSLLSFSACRMRGPLCHLLSPIPLPAYAVWLPAGPTPRPRWRLKNRKLVWPHSFLSWWHPLIAGRGDHRQHARVRLRGNDATNK